MGALKLAYGSSTYFGLVQGGRDLMDSLYSYILLLYPFVTVRPPLIIILSKQGPSRVSKATREDFWI